VKTYDRDYFDRWYRGADAPRGDGELRRSVGLAVAVTESVLDRDVRTVLDVGAGEGRWQPILHELRPEAAYLGIEPSRYALERFGEARNLRQGTLEELHLHAFDDPFDLVVCADVLHYLSEDQVLAGIGELADLVGGAAFLEVFTDRDPADGDREGFRHRPAEWYRATFLEAGLRPLGMQMWIHQQLADDLDEMERFYRESAKGSSSGSGPQRRPVSPP
jgi:predicted TPR repeat methyltransferase